MQGVSIDGATSTLGEYDEIIFWGPKEHGSIAMKRLVAIKRTEHRRRRKDRGEDMRAERF